jgi:hypothetical protein
MMRQACLGVVALCAGCAALPTGGELTGKPLGEFFDALKAELREVHWRVTSKSAACGTDTPREIDLRNASVTLDLRRIAEASIDGELRLVALPLGSTALTPMLSGSAARGASQDITLKLDVTGNAPVFDLDAAPQAASALARTLNAAIDGFMRSSADAPCIRLASLKLQLVLDVERGGGGSFKIVVPSVSLGVDASRRDVNTLTLTWDRIVSNTLH